MNKKHHILITNDDGIRAPGLLALWETVRHFAHVTIIAPDDDRSGTGMSITVHSPIRSTEHTHFPETTVWSLSGTPVDCVKLALCTLLKSPPDLILSGINRGSNAGRNVLYSGTCGAVIEGAIRGIPGIAFSCTSFDTKVNPLFLPEVEKIVRNVLQHPMPAGTFFNVNFPDLRSLKLVKPQGIKVAKQSMEYWGEDPVTHSHPLFGTPYHWLGGKKRIFEEDPESETNFLAQGFTTLAPIHIGNLTNEKEYAARQSFF